MASSLVAIVAGVGPGTGAAIAKRFAAAYPVVLLARNPDSYNPLVEEIKASGGKAIGISADVSDEKSIKNAISEVQKTYGDGVGFAAAVFNASGGFKRAPFLEVAVDDFQKGWDVTLRGAVIFSQATLPLLLQAVKQTPQYPPSLIFTGATASVKANALMSSFNTGKWGVRALSSSLAKEFQPQGVHVAHAIIDGVIDVPATKEWLKDAGADAKISPDGIADAYWHLHTQPRSALTWEVDIRPYVEKW